MNARQERFCSEFVALNCKNATKAAEAAGYSPRTAYSQASDLLKKPEIQNKIQELRAEVFRGNYVSAEELVAGVAGIFRNGESSSVKLKAAELLGRQIGVFCNTGDVTAPVTVVISYDYGDKN